MYIEMTTFAIPTFLLSGLKFLLILGASWVVLVLIGVYFYDRSMNKRIKENK